MHKDITTPSTWTLMIMLPKDQENTPLKPFIPRVPSDRLLTGPMSKEQTSTKSGVTAMMVELLSKRAQLSSPSMQTQAILSGPLYWLSWSGFKKGTFWEIFRLWEPCLRMPVEWLLVSEGSGLPSLLSPLLHLNSLFWQPCWDSLDTLSPDVQDCWTWNNSSFSW